jgi:hypothetical protein
MTFCKATVSQWGPALEARGSHQCGNRASLVCTDCALPFCKRHVAGVCAECRFKRILSRRRARIEQDAVAV